MDPNALVPALIGLAASIVIPLLVRRQTYPRKQVRFHLRAKHLDRANYPPSLRDDPTAELRLLTISLWASGRADVPSSAFDAGSPLIIEFSHQLMDDAVPERQSAFLGLGFERVGPRQVVLQPTLIGRGVEFRTDVVVDAKATYRLRNPLLDIAVLEDKKGGSSAIGRQARRGFRVSGVQVGVGLTILGFVCWVLAVIFSGKDSTLVGELAIGGWWVIAAGIITIVIAASRRSTARIPSGSQPSENQDGSRTNPPVVVLEPPMENTPTQ